MSRRLINLALAPTNITYTPTPMKQFFLTLKSLTRSKYSVRGDAFRAESRAEMSRMSSQGKAGDALSKNVSYLGIKTDSDSKAELIFGAGR